MITNDHIGCRVQYEQRFGTIRDIAHTFADVAIDGMQRPRFYVPIDALVLLSKDHPEYREKE